MNQITDTICGARIQIDRSGQGHCWRDIEAMEINAVAREEIASAILDDKQTVCADFIASNGQHYRWA